MARSIFCAQTAPPRRNLLCQVYETSNIGVIGFIDGDVTIPDLTSADAFVTFVKAQVLLCKATLIQNIVASKPLGAEVTAGKNYGNRTNPQVLSTDFTLAGFDRDHLDNVAWWNDKVRDASDLNFFFASNNYLWIVQGAEASVSFGTVIAEDGKTPIEGQFSIKWNQDGEPLPTNLVGVRAKLNRPMLYTFTSVGVTYVETAGEVFTIAASTAGASITFAPVETGSTPLTWSISGTSIPGLTLNVNTGVITGTPTTPGTYTRDITATNPCGAYGITRVKIVIT